MGWEVILMWCLFISIYGWIVMGVDKYKAKGKERRIAEKHFYLVTLLGGFLGILAGMWTWRHKNRKWKFKAPVLGIFIMQVLVIGVLYLLV